MLAAGIDTVVLGCTHYPFVIPLIEEIAGPGVRVIDPAPAVARQVEANAESQGVMLADTEGEPAIKTRFITTGERRKI